MPDSLSLYSENFNEFWEKYNQTKITDARGTAQITKKSIVITAASGEFRGIVDEALSWIIPYPPRSIEEVLNKLRFHRVVLRL